MLLDVNDNVKIAGGTAADAGLAVARGAQTGTIRNARRDFEFDAARVFDATFAFAHPTRFFDDLADAAAARTGLRDLEKSARTDDLAAPAAGGTIDRARTRFSAIAVALCAGVELANFDLLLHAESGFFERDLHVVTQIGAALPAFAIGRAPPPPPKNVSKIPPAPPRRRRLREKYRTDRGTRRRGRHALGESGVTDSDRRRRVCRHPSGRRRLRRVL